MEFSIVKLFPDNLIQALCNTLIHSLWQGVILSVVTAVIIVSTRKSSPARRYNLLIAALVLFAAGTIVTFIISLKHKPVYVTTSVKYNGGVIVNTPSVPVVVYETALPTATFKDKAINYFNSNSATIVLIWFLIVCARCLQLATGLQGVYYLRRRSLFTADELWRKRVQQLADELGIRRAVKIAESGLAKVPMVVGHLKPLILIPVGLLTAMSAEEIEAILVHELAHIRRSDYLVNLLQNLLEIIFFFNPAVLWLSSLIKTERENCCDDIAVSQSSNKVNYIKALVACQEYNRQPSSALAMALNGKNTPLKTRVTRIISNNNQSLNRMEKAFLAICLVTAGLCTAAFTNAEKINKLVANTAKAIKKEILPENKPGKVNELKTPAPADTTSKHGPKIYSSNK
ncbi:MAG: M56 family metallopeptidase, partial [Bacteroidota bacterium]